jgi:hypothetical protein
LIVSDGTVVVPPVSRALFSILTGVGWLLIYLAQVMSMAGGLAMTVHWIVTELPTLVDCKLQSILKITPD